MVYFIKTKELALFFYLPFLVGERDVVTVVTDSFKTVLVSENGYGYLRPPLVIIEDVNTPVL